LEVFGSAATGQFDAKQSDLDFIVEFDNLTGDGGLLNRYLELASQLEALFNYQVDLVTPNAIRNPYFLKTIDESRELIYEARTSHERGLLYSRNPEHECSSIGRVLIGLAPLQGR